MRENGGIIGLGEKDGEWRQLTGERPLEIYPGIRMDFAGDTSRLKYLPELNTVRLLKRTRDGTRLEIEADVTIVFHTDGRMEGSFVHKGRRYVVVPLDYAIREWL